MSSSFGCNCGERKKPLALRNWVISQYRCNHSAYNGYRRTPSEWSRLTCRNEHCDGCGRSKAAYVDDLYILQGGEEATVKACKWIVLRDTTEPEWWNNEN